MSIILNGDTGITTPGLTNTGTTTIVDLTTTGNTTLGDATTDTLTVGVTGIVKDASGNVGIGTSSPTAKLNVNGSSQFSGSGAVFPSTGTGIEIIGSTVGNTNYIQAYNRTGSTWQDLAINGSVVSFGTAGSERMRIDSSGNLLVGTTTAYARFVAVGSGTTSSTYSSAIYNSGIAKTLFLTRDDGYVFLPTTYSNTIANAANIFINSDGSLSRSTSSLKYKKDVADAVHGLTDLLKLRSVTYKGKSEMDTTQTFGGLIAEEVHESGLTEFVQYANDGSPDALNYGNMVSLCIKSIQEMKAIIDTQASTIQSLTTRITALETPAVTPPTGTQA